MNRLLLITERFAPDVGGLASSATRLVTTLSQQGVEIDVVTWSRYLQPGEVLPREARGEKCGLYRIGLYRHWDMTMPHTLNLLEWLHSSRNYDAVWGHYLFPSGFLAVWFGALQGIVSTVSARGNDIDRAMFPPGDFARLRWTLENAQVITAVSADMSRKIQLLCGRDDVLVLKNAVDAAIFTPDANREITKESLGISPDEVVLGFCGELREKKGQQFLLNALTTVRQQRPACLLIIGEVRVSQESIFQQYKTQQPENAHRVIVTGHLAHPELVAEYLQLCDIYLQPSLWEGMPNALLEAMACGCCCIASDAGGIPEVILHGENGFILGRSQLHRLGEAVLECLAMSAEAKNLVKQAARDRILSQYSIDQEKLQLHALINRLIPNSP
ncbi:glycosyltransferase family 4 protein [Fortiea contorta]|uniref:glycosyltransferase family 4 protein n=1 Tax=Fortiea contorta TaxID=1892405 RepID=UPI00034670D7|nr:glycosyltransferase family 4 protein [Fortiea contorta]